jgi:hypothetical protein
MITIKGKNGKKLAVLSDDMDGQDTVYIDGKPVDLEDVVSDSKLKTQFNKQVKDVTDGGTINE